MHCTAAAYEPTQYPGKSKAYPPRPPLSTILPTPRPPSKTMVPWQPSTATTSTNRIRHDANKAGPMAWGRHLGFRFFRQTRWLRLSYLHEPALPGLNALLRLLGRETGDRKSVG